jgi:hypothetical protein
MPLRIPLGVSDFRQLREASLDYVDKSLLIRDIIDDTSGVLLMPRPRRFGKTLNLSMLRYYFERSEEDRWPLFEGLAIARQDPGYHAHCGRYPTVALSFKDIKSESWATCLAATAHLLARLYAEHRAVLPALTPEEAAGFTAILEERASQAQMESALLNLTHYLSRQHGTRALVLLDEYDTPLHAAYLNGYYDSALHFFRNLLSAALKDNRDLHKGVLTGVLRVAKDSIFTGLNNITVCGILVRPFATAFGFTQEEVEDLLRRAGLLPRLPEVQRWYNGYLFGGQVIYNPWSVLSFLKFQPELPEPYWTDTSGNDLVRDLLIDHGAVSSEEWAQLLRGETLERTISEGVALRDVRAQPNLVWSFLLWTGYLKVLGRRQDESGFIWATLAIPNEEVGTLYRGRFSEWLSSGLGGEGERRGFLQALLRGDAAEVERRLAGWLQRHASFHDTGDASQPERFYHGLVLGLLVSLGPDYDVRSNPEAGAGRCDILISPRRSGRAGVVLEFKVADGRRRETLAGALRAAQRQIVERDYAAALRQAGASEVHELAVAWQGKEVRAAPARRPRRRKG